MIPVLEQYRPHHEELRKRLLRCVCFFGLATAIVYFFKDSLAALCMQPLFHADPEVGKLVYTKLTEAFLSYIKLAFLAGLLLSFPYFLFQAWSFISPGLTKREKKTVRLTVFWGALLFFAGVLFGFFVALPQILKFFMHYADANITPMPKFGLYLTFVGRMLLTFGIAFEIPFLMVAAGSSGLVTPKYFSQKRTWFYFAIACLAFLLTAGELTATTLLCLPLFLLYESGILAGRLFFSHSKSQ